MLSFIILPLHITINADHTRLRTTILIRWYSQLHRRLVLILIPLVDTAAKKMPPHLTTKFARQSPVGAYGLYQNVEMPAPLPPEQFVFSIPAWSMERRVQQGWPYICDQLLQLDLMESVMENQDTIIVIFLSYNILKKDSLGLTTIFFYFFRFRGKRWDTNGYRLIFFSTRRDSLLLLYRKPKSNNAVVAKERSWRFFEWRFLQYLLFPFMLRKAQKHN